MLLALLLELQLLLDSAVELRSSVTLNISSSVCSMQNCHTYRAAAATAAPTALCDADCEALSLQQSNTVRQPVAAVALGATAVAAAA
jgi:hypothetical protein